MNDQSLSGKHPKVRGHIVDWLRDAHAAEKQSENMLSLFCDRLEGYPALKAQIERHIQETRTQALRLETCLERYGESPSAIKDIGGKMLGLGQSLSGVFVEDEVIKGVLAAYAFEHMEIASYRILIAGADFLGDTETKTACENILAEELGMASWLYTYLDEITEAYLTELKAS